MFHNYTLKTKGPTKGRKLENSPISRGGFRQIHTQSHAVRDARFHLLSWSEPVYISAAPWQRAMPVSYQKTSLCFHHRSIHPSLILRNKARQMSGSRVFVRSTICPFLNSAATIQTLVLALIWDYRLCTYSMKKVIKLLPPQ